LSFIFFNLIYRFRVGSFAQQFPGWVLEWVQRLHASDIQLQAASDSPILLPPHPFLDGMNQLKNLGTVIFQSYSFIINLLKTKIHAVYCHEFCGSSAIRGTIMGV